MGYTTQESIIKGHPLACLFTIVIVIALIFSGIIMFTLFKTRGLHNPSWAPDGCTVIMDSRYGARITILVDDPSLVDTEAECASLILSALLSEVDFFETTPNAGRGIERAVDIQFPPRISGSRPLLQYYEVRSENFNFNVLRMTGGLVEYRNETITVTQIMDVANGEIELGFL